MFAFRKSIISVFAVLITCVNTGGVRGQDLYEGSSCLMKSKAPGICTKLPECKSIDEALHKRMFSFKNIVICSFVDSTEVICCPDKIGMGPPVSPSVLILKQTTAEAFDFATPSTVFQGRNAQNDARKNFTQTLNVEKVVTVGDIHLTEQEDFIDLTKLIQRPPGAGNGRQSRFETKPLINSLSTEATTKRPSAKVRDLNSPTSTTRWSTTSTTPRTTILKPAKDLYFQQILTDIARPDYRKNVIDPWSEKEKYTSIPSQTPYWRNTITSKVKEATTTRRAKPHHIRPGIDEVDFGGSSEKHSEYGRNVDIRNQPLSTWISSTQVTTKRPPSSIVFETDKESNEDNLSNTYFPLSSYTPSRPPSIVTESRPRVVSQSASTATQSEITWPSGNSIVSSSSSSTNSIPSAITSVLDPWMINVLIEASGSSILSTLPSSSSSSSSSSSTLPSSTSQLWSELSSSPDDNNVISPSPTPRESSTTESAPGSRVAQRKADKVCDQYQADYLNLPKVLDFHILDGEPTFLGEYPHMAALGYNAEQGGQSVIQFNCGGSLISERYVMTAAHCVNRLEALPTIIRLGTIDLVEPTVDSLDVGVEGVVLFPEYRSARQYHDIALIRLNTTLTFTSRHIFPACLDTDRKDILPNQSVVATGWGSTNTSTRQKSSLLLQVTLTTVELNNCNQLHREYSVNRRLPDGLNDGQMCAFDPNLKKDTCEGDSGGPLQVKLVNISKILGITSFGISCGSAIPSVYARVAFYLDWLERIVWPDITV